MTTEYTLPPLPYAYDALQPVIDAETMRLHHDLHHKAYVDGANETQKALAAMRESGDFKAIQALYPHTATLQLFQINAVTEGTDAQATVSVRLEENGRAVTGKASDTDTMAAAAELAATPA